MWLAANRQGGSCFKTHTPYPKFCRWAKSKKKSKPELLTRAPTVTEETARLIDAGIIFLESAIKDKDDPSIGKPEHHLNIMETFLTKSCDSTDLPDLCFQNVKPNTNKEDLKLRGGSRVKFFDTDEDAIIKVLSLFRSLRVFGEFKEHKKCIISNKNPKGKLCSFCLMRSICLQK